MSVSTKAIRCVNATTTLGSVFIHGFVLTGKSERTTFTVKNGSDTLFTIRPSASGFSSNMYLTGLADVSVSRAHTGTAETVELVLFVE